MNFTEKRNRNNVFCQQWETEIVVRSTIYPLDGASTSPRYANIIHSTVILGYIKFVYAKLSDWVMKYFPKSCREKLSKLCE